MPENRSDGRAGSLVIVGCGIQATRHTSQRTVSEIRRADTVFALVDPFTLDWLTGLNREVHNLCEHYEEDRDRRESYRLMEQALLGPVREGKRVCGVFYGHPGVFARVSHAAIAAARAEGYQARMDAGVSAEACLYADLGLDPGDRGVLSLEATRFLIHEYQIDPACLLLLWQVFHTGNLECKGFRPRPGQLELLVEKLCRWYRPEARAILYEAAVLPIQEFRAEAIRLKELPGAELAEHTTLVIPPTVEARADEYVLDALGRASR